MLPEQNRLQPACPALYNALYVQHTTTCLVCAAETPAELMHAHFVLLFLVALTWAQPAVNTCIAVADGK